MLTTHFTAMLIQAETAFATNVCLCRLQKKNYHKTNYPTASERVVSYHAFPPKMFGFDLNVNIQLLVKRTSLSTSTSIRSKEVTKSCIKWTRSSNTAMGYTLTLIRQPPKFFVSSSTIINHVLNPYIYTYLR